jgi:hypothetical protein
MSHNISCEAYWVTVARAQKKVPLYCTMSAVLMRTKAHSEIKANGPEKNEDEKWTLTTLLLPWDNYHSRLMTIQSLGYPCVQKYISEYNILFFSRLAMFYYYCCCCVNTLILFYFFLFSLFPAPRSPTLTVWCTSFHIFLHAPVIYQHLRAFEFHSFGKMWSYVSHFCVYKCVGLLFYILNNINQKSLRNNLW